MTILQNIIILFPFLPYLFPFLNHRKEGGKEGRREGREEGRSGGREEWRKGGREEGRKGGTEERRNGGTGGRDLATREAERSPNPTSQSAEH